MKKQGYFLLRLAFGVNFFMHGFVRFLSGVEKFASGMSNGFTDTIIPVRLAYYLGYVFTYAELIFGALLLFGLFTKKTIFALAILMIFFITGKCIQHDWGTVAMQMVYVLGIYLLAFHHEYNFWAIDNLVSKKTAASQE